MRTCGSFIFAPPSARSKAEVRHRHAPADAAAAAKTSAVRLSCEPLTAASVMSMSLTVSSSSPSSFLGKSSPLPPCPLPPRPTHLLPAWERQLDRKYALQVFRRCRRVREVSAGFGNVFSFGDVFSFAGDVARGVRPAITARTVAVHQVHVSPCTSPKVTRPDWSVALRRRMSQRTSVSWRLSGQLELATRSARASQRRRRCKRNCGGSSTTGKTFWPLSWMGSAKSFSRIVSATSSDVIPAVHPWHRRRRDTCQFRL